MTQEVQEAPARPLAKLKALRSGGMGWTVVRNAAANVLRGGATAIVALALPHFFSHILEPDRFIAWALLLQIAAYASYMDVGLQTAVARFLAQALEEGSTERQRRLIATALVMLSGVAVFAYAVTGAVVFFLPVLFHEAPLHLLGELRASLLILGLSAALLIPLSAFTGVLLGLRRNEYPALAIGGSRLAGALAAILLSRFTHSLIVLASALAFCHLIGGLVQVFYARKLLPTCRFSFVGFDLHLAKRLFRFCSTLVVFSFGMLLITGLDVTIVGHFHYEAVAYYSVAATLVSMISGLNGAFFNALLAPVAVLQSRGEYKKINQLIRKITSFATCINLLVTGIFFLWGLQLLTLWVGSRYAAPAFPILKILAIAQTLRLSGVGFLIASIAIGEQRWCVPGMFVEALANLALSLLGSAWVGPMGVAVATLAGSILGVAWMLLFTMRWIKQLNINRLNFLRQALLLPFLCSAPLFAAGLLFPQHPFAIALLSAPLATALLWTIKNRRRNLAFSNE